MKRLGFVGAGRMGLPMVQRVAAAGYEVCALARTEAAREHIARTVPGTRTTHDIREVADGTDAVMVCVFTDAQVREVCLAGSSMLDALPSEAVVVVHTTGSPATVEAIAARGAHVVDAPVSGGPHDIATGSLTLFVGGADETVNRLRPVLRSYADPVLHVGPLGAGQHVKLLNNAVFAAQLGVLREAARVATTLGLDETALLSALPHASADSRALRAVAARGSVSAFAESVRSFLDKDIDTVRRTARELGVDMGVLDLAIDTAASGRPLRQQGDMRHGTC